MSRYQILDKQTIAHKFYSNWTSMWYCSEKFILAKQINDSIYLLVHGACFTTFHNMSLIVHVYFKEHNMLKVGYITWDRNKYLPLSNARFWLFNVSFCCSTSAFRSSICLSRRWIVSLTLFNLVVSFFSWLISSSFCWRTNENTT